MSFVFEDSLCGRQLGEVESDTTKFAYVVGAWLDCIVLVVLLRFFYTLRWRHAVQTAGFVVSIGVGLALKEALAVVRPPTSCLGSFALPSGDTQQLTAALYILYAGQSKFRAWKLALSVLLVSLEAFSRVNLGHHTVGQTLAGIALGLVMSSLWARLVQPVTQN